MKQKVLITGGAGYIGACLVPILLEDGFEVCVYDNLTFNANHLLRYVSNPDFSFIKGNVLDRPKLQEAIHEVDHIIHLAALVGYPACRAQPTLAREINVTGTENVVASCDAKYQKLYFGSTGSNYGALPDGFCDEDTPLNPLSLYGLTKTEAERKIMDYPDSIAFRFATAYGVSPRMRLDLLLNNLVYDAVKQRYMVVYESHFMRTFIHVRDIARSFLHAIKNHSSMRGEVYNVGTDENNLSKLQLGNLVSQITGAELHLADFAEDEDKRNYQVSYSKIRKAGFDCINDISSGIKELVHAYSILDEKSDYRNA